MSEMNADIKKVIRIDNQDWFLCSLVDMVNQGGFSFGITLNVGGFLISGELIGGKAYFEGFGSELAGVFKDAEAAKRVKEGYAKAGEDIYSEKTEDKKDMPVMFIHMKNTKFYNTSGKPIPDNRGVWWRGRISEVSGFVIGKLAAE